MRKLICRSSLKLNDKTVGYRYGILDLGSVVVSLDINRGMYNEFELLLGIGNVDIVGKPIEGYIDKGVFVTKNEVNVIEVKDLDHAKSLLIKYDLFYEKVFSTSKSLISLNEMLTKGRISAKLTDILNSIKTCDIDGVLLEEKNNYLEFSIYTSKVSDIFRLLIHIYKGKVLNIDVVSNFKKHNFTVDTSVTKLIRSLRAINKNFKFIDVENINGVVNDFTISCDDGLCIKTIIKV